MAKQNKPMDCEFAAEVWKNLSNIDVADHVQEKGGLTYLSWAWAWGILMGMYPGSEFKLLPEHFFVDNTVETKIKVTVREGEKELTRFMWRPVMDHRNAAIENPTARQISDGRMRTLVKCLALLGLGHYIYAGEDVPDPTKAVQDWVDGMNIAANTQDAGMARELWDEFESSAWNLISSHAKKKIRDLVQSTMTDDDLITPVLKALNDPESLSIKDAWSTLNRQQQITWWKLLTGVQQQSVRVNELGKEND